MARIINNQSGFPLTARDDTAKLHGFAGNRRYLIDGIDPRASQP
ncbi:MAG: hypothetical protein QF586_02500 [Arenicellales bacterium]|jgi:hypothetical protein|nr:hypothetical protein [Arenicellales bacterium]MDP6672534.1 hypothetical protein [Arenicellales bacterium]MDP6725194.1 hypothetical protein [Arenicellales bacterium]MDP7482724.1 hypothetical protein [Arenicellales bacterium]MEE1539747.1 hypothetical protein [Arenicellales bacterium]